MRGRDRLRLRPFSTNVETVLMTVGTKNTDTAMTMRMTRPHTARPVAVSAGFRFSTVSVKLAIHGAYAVPRKMLSSTSRMTNVV